MLFHINTVPVTISRAEGVRYSSSVEQPSFHASRSHLGQTRKWGALPRDFCFAPMNGHRETQRPVMRIVPIGLTLLASASPRAWSISSSSGSDPTKVLGTPPLSESSASSSAGANAHEVHLRAMRSSGKRTVGPYRERWRPRQSCRAASPERKFTTSRCPFLHKAHECRAMARLSEKEINGIRPVYRRSAKKGRHNANSKLYRSGHRC
jgi:hypothetical protein